MEKSDEKVTMEVICSIANSINEMMKFTVDFSENHENEQMFKLKSTSKKIIGLIINSFRNQQKTKC